MIVVDDGSSDGTGEYVRSLTDERVRIIRHVRAEGVSAARNAGIDAARGTWIGFLDDDDLWAPDKVRSQLDALMAQPGARWSCVGSVAVDPSLRIVAWNRPPTATDLLAELRTGNPVPGGGSGVVAHRDLLESVGGFDTRFLLLEDWDYWLRLAQRSPVASVDRPLTANVMHGANLSVVHPGQAEELSVLEQKYEAMGIPLSPALMHAGLAAREGASAKAAQILFRAGIRQRRVEPMLHGLVAWGGPSLRRAARKAYDWRIPGEWRAEGKRWLEPIRAQPVSGAPLG